MKAEDAARRWRRTWAAAWPVQDTESLVALQAAEGTHWAGLFRPYRGPDGLRQYLEECWAEETRPTRCWFAEPLLSSAGAAFEYWALRARR